MKVGVNEDYMTAIFLCQDLINTYISTPSASRLRTGTTPIMGSCGFFVCDASAS